MADIDNALLEALDEADPVRRRRLLGGLPPEPCSPAALARVVGTLRGATEVGARTAAMEVLAALGDRAIGVLGDLLDDPGPGVRRLAVDVVGLMSSPAAAVLLRRAASDPSTTVRAAALEGVARFGAEAAAAPRPPTGGGAQTGLEFAREVLLGQLGPDTPPVVALAALLGAVQLDLQVPAATLTRWLDEPLTAGASLRLLGRAGEFKPVVAAVTAGSRHRMRSALQGLAEGLERGRRIDPASLDVGARERVLANLAVIDVEAAAAAVVVLAAVGELGGLRVAMARPDHARLLPSFHRAVAVAAGVGVQVEAFLVELAIGAPSSTVDLIRELEEAARRRARAPAASSGSVGRPGGLDPQTFEALVTFFAREAGLLFTTEAKSRIEARLAPRLEVRGAADHRAYLELLKSDAVEAAVAIDAVTVHETYFFRETASLEGLRDEIAPALGLDGRTLHVWSAGCSSGEEPYSLATILLGLEAAGRISSFDVLGTDVSPVSIAHARRARYASRSFRGPVDAEAARHFETNDDGTRTPTAALRDRVRFDVLNLIDIDGYGRLPRFDVIFCRNVLIYLTASARQAVLQAFFQQLRPGGALVLGHSESLLHVENPFAVWPLRRGLAYRRSS